MRDEKEIIKGVKRRVFFSSTPPNLSHSTHPVFFPVCGYDYRPMLIRSISLNFQFLIPLQNLRVGVAERISGADAYYEGAHSLSPSNKKASR